ncbi:MAG TPA: HEAT repeat domain-containing protein [Candidatus Norongarragalinales archaeon]|nr:HEAT repeat domain-containing protein [Candidatus Norongarragalinales archaeon]
MSKLEKFLTRGHPQMVINHLAKIRNPANAAKALEHEDSGVRWAAVRALGMIGASGAPFTKDIVEKALRTYNSDKR